MISAEEFFNLDDFEHKILFSKEDAVWGALDRLKAYLAGFFNGSRPLSNITGQIEKPVVIYRGEIRNDVQVESKGSKNEVQAFFNGKRLEGASIILPGAYLFDDQIIIGPGTVVEPGALIKGPTVIGNNTEVRQGAYLRGDCLVGNGCVVGHTTEIKSSIMLDGAKAGHFAYIGDSILGNDVNIGAGTKLANLMVISGTVSVRSGKQRYETGRRKLGAILGDRTETGCNSVTSPGTLMGPGAIVYPCLSVPGGLYPGKTIIRPSAKPIRIIEGSF
jgi:acetyltransferase-like isoleucine patch superfamily enzyme